MLRIKEVAAEGKVSRGQVADAHRIDDVETGETVGEGCHGEPAIPSQGEGGLENSSEGRVGLPGPGGVAAESAGDVDKEPASVGIWSVIFHIDGVGPASRQGEVVPEGPSCIVSAGSITGAACDLGASGEGMEGESIVERGLAHLPSSAVHPRDQPLSETNEIGGRVGGVVLIQLDGETAKFLVLQGNFKIGKDLSPSGTDHGDKEKQDGRAEHEGTWVLGVRGELRVARMGHLVTAIRKRATPVAGEVIAESSTVSCHALPRSDWLITAELAMPSSVLQTVLHCCPSSELCTS